MKEFEKPIIELWKILSEDITDVAPPTGSWGAGEGDDEWED